MSDPMDWWTPTVLHRFLGNLGIPQPRLFNYRIDCDLSDLTERFMEWNTK